MKKLLGFAAVLGSVVLSGCNHNQEESTSPAPLPQQANQGAPMAPVNPNGPTDQTPANSATDVPTTPGTTPPASPDQGNGGTPSVAPTANNNSTPPAPMKPATNYPMGIVIPGKKGLVQEPVCGIRGAGRCQRLPPWHACSLPLYEQDFHRSADLIFGQPKKPSHDIAAVFLCRETAFRHPSAAG